MLKSYLKDNTTIILNNDGMFMIEILINCGSINESKGIRGYSHLLEHIKFNKFKNKSIKLETGNFNAYTSKDVTAYYVKCNEENMESAIEQCINIVFNTQFSNNNLENEKNIVLEEMYLTRSREFLYGILLDTIMDKHNLYSNSIIGTKNDINEATNKSLRKYNDYFYHLSNSKIICSCSENNRSIVGTVLLKIIKKYKVPLYPPNQIKLYNTSVDDCDFRRFTYSMIVHNHMVSELNTVYLVFRTLEKRAYNSIYINFIHYILANNDHNSLLFKHIRKKYGLIYNIHSNIDSYTHFGIYYIGFNTSSDKIDIIINDIFQIIQDNLHTTKKMTQVKYDRFKKMYISKFIYQIKDNNIRFEFEKKFMYLDNTMNCKTYMEAINELSLKQFTGICNESLNINKLGSYVISKSVSQNEHITAFKIILDKFKNIS